MIFKEIIFLHRLKIIYNFNANKQQMQILKNIIFIYVIFAKYHLINLILREETLKTYLHFLT